MTRSKEPAPTLSEQLRERIGELRQSGKVTDRAWAEGYDAALEDVIDCLDTLDTIAALRADRKRTPMASTELKPGQRRCHDCPRAATDGKSRCDRCRFQAAARLKLARDQRKGGSP